MSLKTLELRNEREVWWCLYTQVRVQNVVKSKHGIKKKKKKPEPPFEERERERERVCDDFSKRRKVSTEIGLTLPSRW